MSVSHMHAYIYSTYMLSIIVKIQRLYFIIVIEKAFRSK